MNKAPWSPDIVQGLNRQQKSGVIHPYTCGDEKCRAILIATTDGWICSKCNYTQDWFHVSDFPLLLSKEVIESQMKTQYTIKDLAQALFILSNDKKYVKFYQELCKLHALENDYISTTKCSHCNQPLPDKIDNKSHEFIVLSEFIREMYLIKWSE